MSGDAHSTPRPTELLLLRYAEIFLKGGNRAFFERQLHRNLKQAVAQIPGSKIERTHGRFLCWPAEGGARRAELALQRVFGLASLSPTLVTERSMDAINAAAIEAARASAGAGRPSFKVETRRADKRFLPQSPEVSRLAGAAIVGALGLPVDVHTPGFTVGIEVGYEQAFVYSRVLPGPGGLPVGVTGKVELLLSGGIDSPVAGWLALRRGCHLGASYFHSFPYASEKTKEKVVTLARMLAAWQQSDIVLSVIPFTDAQKTLRESSGDGRLAVVLYRRMMLRVAEQIARRNGKKALLTGEALAQVASQTLDNLGVIGDATRMLVLRPCLAHDKQETITLAKKIGTYETSILPYDDGCALFVPEHPETRAKLETVEKIEERIDIEKMVRACLERTEEIVCSP